MPANAASVSTFPFFASPLVGRDEVVEHVLAALEDPACTIVTLVGPGGIGKTRLATEVANSLRAQTPDPPVFIPLSVIRDVHHVMPEIARALGIRGTELPDLIREDWSRRDGLVVIDNIEHVVDFAPELLSLVPPGRTLRLLGTSQRPLMIEGERIVRLNPLATPVLTTPATNLDANPSFRLFVDRARSLDPDIDFDTNPVNRAAIAEICRRLDGIPLAIELAPARTSVLPPQALLAQLDRGLSVLGTRRRDIPERFRTMHSAISWTYDLLNSDEQRLLRWLSVFPSGFDLKLVERLTAFHGLDIDSLDAVGALIDRSLVRQWSGEDAPRYYILSTLRSFGMETLDAISERNDAQEFLAAFVLELMGASRDAEYGEAKEQWFRLLDRESATIRAAIDWALKHGDAILPFTVAARSWEYLARRGMHREAIERFDQIAPFSADLPLEISVPGRIAQIHLLASNGQLDEANRLVAALDLDIRKLNDPQATTEWRSISAAMALNVGEPERATSLFLEARDYAQQHHLPHAVAIADVSLAKIALQQRRFPDALARSQAALLVLRENGDRDGTATVLETMAASYAALGNNGQAVDAYAECIEMYRSIGDRASLVSALANLGDTLLHMDDDDWALDVLSEANQHAQEYQLEFMMSTVQRRLAECWYRKGNRSNAVGALWKSLESLQPTGHQKILAEVSLTIAVIAHAERRHADAFGALIGSCKLREEAGCFLPAYREQITSAIETEAIEVLDTASIDRIRSDVDAMSPDSLRRMLKNIVARMSHRVQSVIVTVPWPETTPLTGREQEVLNLLVQGHGTSEMAEHLFVSPRTITTHLSNIMIKLDVSTRAELVSVALRRNLVDPER